MEPINHYEYQEIYEQDDTRFFTEVHLLAGKLVLVVAIHPLGGSHANWHHTANPQPGAVQPTQDEDHTSHQRSINRLLPRVTRHLTSATDLQWLSSNVCAVKSRPNAPITRPDAPISSRARMRAPRPRHDRTHCGDDWMHLHLESGHFQ